ncbi:MAG: ABC transporter substrate-binding protein [Actinomycetota bacterium]
MPEHFNLPWRTARERGVFEDAGIDLTWVPEPAGTGAMTAAVEAGDVDAALVLTEGAMAAIGRGSPLRIEGWWVESPLDWGIHVGNHVTAAAASELTNHHRFAISRFGSGSHLMAHVLADNIGLELSESSFVVCGGIEGAVDAMTEGAADVFLWERAMTAPLVRAGTIGRIGIQPTPWPCFVAIRHLDVESSASAALRTALRLAALEGARLRAGGDLIDLVVERYQLHADDVDAWLSTLRWPLDPTEVDIARIGTIRDRAASYGLLPADLPISSLIA